MSSGGFRTWHHPQTVSVQAPPVLLRCAATGWCHEGHSCQISCELKYGGFLSHGESPSHHGFQCSNGLLLDDLGVLRGYPALETSICQEMLAVPGGCPLQLSEEDSRSGSLDQIC